MKAVSTNRPHKAFKRQGFEISWVTQSRCSAEMWPT